jgi:hypothetical protein
MKRYSVVITIVGVAMAVALGIGWRELRGRHSVNAISGAFELQNGTDGSSTVDLSDIRNLMGIAYFSFVGKVTAQGDAQKFDMFTLYPYKVKVLLNIKGNLQGTITVYTNGLQSGSTYVMGARWNENNWGIITALLDGRTTLSNDATLSDEQLKVLAENDERVIALQKAYPSEVSFYGDVRHNTTWNSYESLLSRHPLVSSPFEAPSPLPIGQSRGVLPMTTPSLNPSASVSTPSQARDNRRIGDLRQLQIALSLYFKDHHDYPTNLDALIPQYLGPTLRDPSTGDRYGYATDRNKYVFSTKLEDTTNPYLGNLNDKQLGTDLDGNQLGVNCDDPVYCVGG